MISIPNLGGADQFRLLIEDIGQAQAAKYLRVSPRTIRRWLSGQEAPGPVWLSLFLLSSYGRAAINSDQATEISLLYRQVDTLRATVARLQDQIEYLSRSGDWHSANDPIVNFDAPIAAVRRPIAF